MRYGPPPQGPPLRVPYPPLAPYKHQHRSTKKRFAAIAAGAAAVLASTSVYATTLTVTGNQVGAGAVSMTSCDTDGVTVRTGPPIWDEAAGKHYFSFMTVTDINPDCDKQVIYVQPQKSDGTALGGGGQATFDSGSSHLDTAVVVVLTGDHAFESDYAKSTVAIHET